MPEPPPDQIVMRGTRSVIAYALDASGRMPAKEFLDRDHGPDAPTKQERAGLYHVFKVMTETGRVTNQEQFKKEEGDIFGFKKYQARIAAFQIGNVWFLTHGFKKKQDRWPRAELDRAVRIKQEYLARRMEKQR